jgi:Xaa-Pro dipeptidase
MPIRRMDLKNLLSDLDLLGARIGVEYDTHGLTGANCHKLDNQLQSFAELVDASYVVSRSAADQEPGGNRLCQACGRIVRCSA